MRRLDPFWYFPDAQRSRNEFTVESAYPFTMYMHQDELDVRYGDEDQQRRLGERRVAIRKWVERQIQGDVIWWLEDKSFHRVYPASPTYKEGKQRLSTHIQHGYYAFAFETEHEATGFRLQFDGVVTQMLPHPPGSEPVEGAEDFENGWEARAASGEGYGFY
ncbi:MAG: hypothetical protein EOP83_00240 [Verrucomicrobiaceae bacterium]|nr:MAG: hypothetical protein EOP83_00240 [Verrucomicrobiaceae bacterium]